MSTYTPIASVTLDSAQSSVTFSGIPQTYTDLVLVANIAQEAANNSLRYRFNNDSGSNYSATYLLGNGSSANSGRESNITSAYVSTTGSTTLETNYILHIMNYSNATTYKTAIGRGNRASAETDATVGLWRNTAAITTISFALGSGFPTNNFAANSTFNLYGVNAQLSAQAKAYGGDTIVTDGTYWYHTFLSSGTFTPTEALTADYLVVAGGGSGGGPLGRGGGGGAGGLRCTVTATGGGGSVESALSLAANTGYTVTIGGGGAAIIGGGGAVNGNSGSDSVFSTITATGGGGGGGANPGNGQSGLTGGSGGGAGSANGVAGSAGSGTTNQGYAGGTASLSSAGFGAGGGGGAGATGGNGSSTNGGNGGNGVATSISGTSTTYAGGGGGGVNTGTAGTGGTGGGGKGGDSSSVGAGTANTGGGGGGSYDTPGSGSGGSGIVIVRYAV